MSNRWLPLAAIGISVLMWSAAYVVSGWALETTSPAVLSVGRFAVALLVLSPALGGAIALVGVAIATLAAPDVEPSPPGSALPEPSDLATGAGGPVQAGGRWKRS